MMSSFNRYSSDGNVDLSAFEFTFGPDDPSSYHAHLAAEPLRYTKSNNVIPSYGDQSRQDTSMLRSRSDFDFSDSSTGVGAGFFMQTNSISSLPGPRSVPSGFQGQGPLPISKFLTDRNSPWTPTGLETPRNSRVYSAFAEPNLNFSTYRNQHQSEIESTTTAQCHSDSGYASQPIASQSVKSGEYSNHSPEYSVYPDFENFAVSPMPNASESPQQPGEEGPSKSTQRSRGGKRKCERCSEILKCPSDYRKHMLKHDKPNKCDIPGCPRTDGFSTINDLQRHQKSKHGIGLDSITTSFKCASPSCKNHEKIWPRRDNFKQHILRMHKSEDVNQLIARSEIKGGTSTDGASMEADLAGMSRHAESQPPTVRPGELEMDSPETLDASWLLPTLSDGLLAHRSNALPARERNFQNITNYSTFNGLRGNNESQNLDALAIVSAIHPAIDANRIVSSLGPGYAYPTPSSLASPEVQQVLNDPSFLRKVAILQKCTEDQQKNSLENPGIDDLAGGDMEHDDGSSGSSTDSQIRQRNDMCKYCPKGYPNKAALTKHEYRHTKPWQCTHYGCVKPCGSKDDWKRHERSHVPTCELWFCQMPDLKSPSGKCAIVAYDRTEFEIHLREDHYLTTKSQVADMMLECNIGYSHQYTNAYYQVNFWCGFCKKVIQADHDPHRKLEKGKDDNNPSNHRWDHLDAHFIKEGKRIVHFDVNGNKLPRASDWTDWETNMAREVKDAKFFWEHNVYGKENPRKIAREKRPIQSHLKMRHKSNGSQPMIGEKRKAVDQLVRPEGRPKGRKSVVVIANWHCCQCGNGPISVKNHASCPGAGPQCGHERCDGCDGNYANDVGEEELLLRAPQDSWNQYRHDPTPLVDDIMHYQETGETRGQLAMVRV